MRKCRPEPPSTSGGYTNEAGGGEGSRIVLAALPRARHAQRIRARGIEAAPDGGGRDPHRPHAGEPGCSRERNGARSPIGVGASQRHEHVARAFIELRPSPALLHHPLGRDRGTLLPRGPGNRMALRVRTRAGPTCLTACGGLAIVRPPGRSWPSHSVTAGPVAQLDRASDS